MIQDVRMTSLFVCVKIAKLRAFRLELRKKKEKRCAIRFSGYELGITESSCGHAAHHHSMPVRAKYGNL